MISFLKFTNILISLLCAGIAVAVTGCDKEPASLEKPNINRSLSLINDQFSHEVQTKISTTMQIVVVPPAAPPAIEKQFYPLPKVDPFLLAATASSNVLIPLPTPAISRAQSFDEVSELIRRQVQEKPASAAGTNPFTSFSTTPRKP